MTFPFFEHYSFTRDVEYLKEKAYPIMKSSAQFVLDFLIKDSEGQWVTVPSDSPENKYYDPKTGEPQEITYGCTMDIQIITELFNNCIRSTEILGLDLQEANRVTFNEITKTGVKNGMANPRKVDLDLVMI